MKYIGIDPGVNTGFAVWDSEEKQFVEISTLDFWRAIDRVNDFWYEEDLTIVIEDPGQHRTTYARHRTQKGQNRINQNVGAANREATLLIERFRQLGYTVIPVKPVRRKLTAGDFKQVTGYTGRTSEHGRDAGMLVFGR